MAAPCGTGGQAMHWMLEQNTRLRDVVLSLDRQADRPADSSASGRVAGSRIHSGILLLCIRTGTTIWCRGRPWLALPRDYGAEHGPIPVPEIVPCPPRVVRPAAE